MHQQEPSEPFDGLWDEIPELADGLAPKPTLGTHHISPEAIRSRSRRIFEKRADGLKKVSDQIWNDWKAKGPKKDPYENRCLYYVEMAVKGSYKKASRVEISKRARLHEKGAVGSMSLQPDDLIGQQPELGICLGGGSLKLNDGIDLTKSDEEDGADTKTRKALGIPEMDPDALPSALTQKLWKAISDSISNLEEIQTEISQAYSNGVVAGFSKEPFMPKETAEVSQKGSGQFEPGDTSFNYAEVLADGAPAASLHHFAKVARQEVTGTNLDHEMCKKNASRDAHAFVGKWGLAWKVPLSYMDYGDGEKLPYLSPISFVRFLVEKAPELLVGGCPEMKTGRAHLEAFWREYKGTHPSHRLFHDEHSARMLSNTFAFALHGDEGRGLKRANTTVVMMESCIGVGTWSNMFHKRNLRECSECCVCEATTKKFRSVAGAVARDNPLSAFQTTNLKQNSFLTKFVLAVIPGKNPELVRQLLVHVTRDLHSLYHEGVMLPSGERYFVAITGLKGDLPWHIGVWGELTRCFQKQLAADTFMCHECLAGVTAYPFEDTSDEPSWAPTIFTRRPYAVPPTVCSIPFERDVPGRPDERIFRRDFFHNTKMGVLRDYVGSTIMLLCKLKYWHEQGQSNSK
ncbi:Putative E3 ubiquitin-protein ligase HERC1, partial [Durusdinium trenchii]